MGTNVNVYFNREADNLQIEKVIIINRDRLVFVNGSDDMSRIPYNPNSIPMSFIYAMDYKFRSRTFATHFGIYINR